MQTGIPASATMRSSWLLKFAESSLAVIAITNTIAMAVEFLPAKILTALGRYAFEKIIGLGMLLSLLLGIAFSIYWHRKEIKQAIQSPRVHVILRGILRYWLAFEISTYGFAKLLKTQFAHSFQRDDMLVGGLNGFSLTWHYFSWSYALAVIIGILQIGGSILLLFRRTTLLGVTILLPVLVNILLINIFYQIAFGAFINSVLFTVGLLYLLLLRWRDLKKIFLQATDSLPPLRLGIFTYVLKLLPVTVAFSTIWYFARQNHPVSILGKWKVDRMIRDRDTVKTDAWLKDSDVWSNVYLDDYGQLSVCANPYMFDMASSQHGSYQYDSLKKNISLVFGYAKKDTVNLSVSNYDGKKMEWRGLYHNDTTVIFLSKQETQYKID